MKHIPSLEALGLTRLEALAYAYLVAHPAATGYKVSKGIGKPTANVYRALEGLERKGAVRNNRDTPPLFHAVAPDELLDQLEQDFMDRREIAAQALRALEPLESADADDDGVFTLKSAEQVVGRARVMLSAVRRVALLDLPAPLASSLQDAVADARARGARVTVLAHDAPAKHRDTIVVHGDDARVLRLAVDGRYVLLASLTADGGVRDAIGSRNPLLARSLHDALATDAFYARVAQGVRDGLSVDEVEEAFERCRELRTPAR